jgi:uncharacterized protein YkwD
VRRALAAILVLAALAAAPVQALANAGPQRLVAPPSACPSRGAGAIAQERQMLCLVNFARHGAGKPALVGTAGFHRAAVHKSIDILSCDEFSHEACGRDFAYWVERFSDCRSVAENIAWGTGSLGGVRAIFEAWMHSSGHRENILGPYRETGISLRIGSLEGNAGAHVWSQDFGADC